MVFAILDIAFKVRILFDLNVSNDANDVFSGGGSCLPPPHKRTTAPSKTQEWLT